MFPIASHFLSHSILAMLQVPKVGEFPMFQKYWWWANQMALLEDQKKKKNYLGTMNLNCNIHHAKCMMNVTSLLFASVVPWQLRQVSTK
jgi:hypothetical protein